jgi:thiamine biosynthesis lipoprotein
MDTIVTVTFTDKSNAIATHLNAGVDSILKFWEEHYSLTSDSSEVKKVNQRTSDTIAISKQLGKMIAIAIQYGDSLNGGFDFTILPLKELWGLSEDSPDSQPAPSPSQIDSAKSIVNYKNVTINSTYDTLVFLSPITRIDVGGIAKCFALMAVEDFFVKNGIKNYLINGGGDIIGGGNKPDKSSWVIGIQDPRKPDNVIVSFKLDKKSVFTSGDYERFRFIDGKRVHHIFNPHTGYSCTNNQSVTIYGPDPIQNKFLSTGLFCLPADSILKYISKRPSLDCFVVDSAGKYYVDERWKNSINLQ